MAVKGDRTSTDYSARDLHRGDLWSRIQPGDALQFTLTVAARERNKVALKIISLQAGYRALGPGVEDHPYYSELKAQQTAASGSNSCVTNYQCEITPSNAPPGSATVALVIQNLYQCSGSLINDVPGDNTPYVLTARHCEAGKLGGGSPGAASDVTVYWDAVSSCGDTLESIYDSAVSRQTGAQTVVEQQDAWLIKLDANPVVTDAQFAGFDASGQAVQGGYTIHHAEGYDKQFTGWFGQAATIQLSGVLGVLYVSDFVETVNQIGNIGPGASGSGLFDQNNHLVGSLSLGRVSSDPSGYGSCPVGSPPAPNGSNGIADFTSLAAVWNSTADATSSTGSTTLKSVLDPANTGTVVVASAPVASVAFTSSLYTQLIGQPLLLSWNAPGATQCTAAGGFPGDGWTGTLAASGSKTVTESNIKQTVYTLQCSFSGNRTASASTTVMWVGPTPQLQLTPSPTIAWTTTPVTLGWTSNLAPCSIVGGSVSLNALPASGQTTITEANAGDVLYTLTCGPPTNSGSLPTEVQWETPSLLFYPNGTDRLLGASFELHWAPSAPVGCVPSGGAPNDGWSGTAFSPNDLLVVDPQVSTAGTYTYTITCSVGTISLQKSVTVTFENNAAYATATLSKPSVVFSDSPSDYSTVVYHSNLSVCSFVSNPSIGSTNNPDGSLQEPPLAQGEITLAPGQSGTYQLTLQCSADINGTSYTASAAPMTLTVSPPASPTEQITFSPSTVVAGETFSIAWSAANASHCDRTGGIPGDTWPGTYVAPSGSVIDQGVAGQFSFGLTCHSIDPNTPDTTKTVSLTIVTLSANLTASASSVTAGNSFTLTWTSTKATTCTASGGGANGVPWTGLLATSGSVTQTATTDGTFTYTIECSQGPAVADSQVKVAVSGASAGGTSSGGSGGGGGADSALELLLLAFLAAVSGIAKRETGG